MSNDRDNNPKNDATFSSDVPCSKQESRREKAGDQRRSELDIEKGWFLLAKADPDQFVFFYDKYNRQVRSYLYSRTYDHDLADDLCQATFTRALDRLWQFRWQGVSFGAWLFRIAKSLLNDHIRRSETRLADSIDDVKQSSQAIKDKALLPDEELEDKRLNQALHDCIEKLDPNCRDWITLHYIEGMKTAEVAVIAGVKTGTMKARLSRCLDKIREGMENHYEH